VPNRITLQSCRRFKTKQARLPPAIITIITQPQVMRMTPPQVPQAPAPQAPAPLPAAQRTPPLNCLPHWAKRYRPVICPRRNKRIAHCSRTFSNLRRLVPLQARPQPPPARAEFRSTRNSLAGFSIGNYRFASLRSKPDFFWECGEL
jgi:hypothetical protein